MDASEHPITLNRPSNPGAGADSTARSLDSIPWLAVLLFMLAVPATSVWVNASGHDFARVIEVFLCLVCAVGMVAPARVLPAGRPSLILIGVALLAAASTLSAPDLRMATRELCLSIGLSGVGFTIARRVATSSQTVLLSVTAVAGASYAALVGLGLAANIVTTDHLRPFDLLIGYDNGRFFNHVQTAMLPLLAIAALRKYTHRGMNRLAFFGLAVGLALLVLSEGRATGLALVVAGTVGIALFRQATIPIFRMFGAAGLVAAAIYGTCFVLLPQLAGMRVDVLHVDGVTDTGSAYSRFILWHIALDGIRQAPLLGIGPMHFSHTWNSDAAHPHNIYLQVAEEWGVPMASLLLGIGLTGLHRFHRTIRRHRGDIADRTFGVGLFITLIAIGVDGMLSGNFVMPVSQVWIAIVIGASIGWVRRNAPETLSPVPSRSVWRHARLLPLAAMLWLVASVAPELGNHLLDRPGPPGSSTDAGAPRFWSNGWF